MTNQDKYILELETKLQDYQKKEKEWVKEQQAQVKVFKDKETEIKTLKTLNNFREQENKKDKQTIKELTKEGEKQFEQVNQLKKEKKDLERDNQKLYQALHDSSAAYKELEESLKTVQQKLLSEQSKNEILEEKIEELEEENTISESNSPNSLDQTTSKILEEQEKTKQLIEELKQSKKQKDNEIWKLNTLLDTFRNQVKVLLGISDLAQELPSNWKDELIKKKELIRISNKLFWWEKEFPNTTPQELNKKINQIKNEKSYLKEQISELKNEKKQIQPEVVIYFCDICQTTKNSRVDGEVFQIKITARPNVISNVCLSCKKNVIEVREDEDDWFFNK